MLITSVTIRMIDNKETGMLGVCSFVFDEMFSVHDVKIIEREKTFLAMPAKKTPSGPIRDIAHPINAQVRVKLEELVLALYSATQVIGSSYQRFVCVNTDRDSLLEQQVSDFEAYESVAMGEKLYNAVASAEM